jgi:undecaprenyl pyrophosphate phosphatase UppP
VRRSVVFSVAGAALGLAVVLTLLGVGDDPAALTNGQALVLGIVQGLTELLPISSSGHLILVPWAAEWTYLEQNDRFNQTFDVALHLGTLVAVAAYFWSDFVRLVRAWLDSVARRRIASNDELAPGVSRSGITITAGRFMKLDRDSAARFSFYLLLPTVLGAVLLKGVQDVLLGELPDGWTGPFLVGTLAALGSGLLAIEWLLGYVRRHTYGVFVAYRLVVAVLVLLAIVSGIRDATF